MQSIPPFLARLGLDQGAAGADIRRAYARELKLIDQQRDAAGFQLLREAYETAMQSVKRRAEPAASAAPAQAVPQFGMPGVPVTQVKPVPAGAVPEAARAAPILPEKTPLQVNPYALASTAFASFSGQFASLAQESAEPDLAACRSLLARALGDPALLNISARFQFEGRVALLLAGGWQRGHEVLLEVAAKAFNWHEDRRRLFEFGPAGAQLSRALDEGTLFASQPGLDYAAQCQVVARLRSAALPAPRDVVSNMRRLAALETRYPTWLPLVTDVGNIERWRALERQIPKWRRKFMSEAKEEVMTLSGASSGGGWYVWIIMLVIFNLVRLALQNSSPLPAYSSTPAPAHSVPWSPPAPPAAWRPPAGKPSDQQIDTILALVQYQIPPKFFRDELQVEFEIELDALGNVLNVEVTDHSRDVDYDAAVAAAIRAAAPLLGAPSRHFRWYHIRPGSARARGFS